MKQTQQNEIEKIDMATDIAVIGSGYNGLKAASQISESGYNVILVPQHNATDINLSILDIPSTQIDRLKALETEVANNANVEILPPSTLVEATGDPGNFTLKFLSADTMVEKKAGAVVVATDTALNSLIQIYGLTPAANVVSLSEFENLLASETTKKEIQNGEKTVAFLVGFAHEGSPLLMKRVLNNVSEITSMDGCSAYVYVNNIKVADDGLERLYKKGRDNGAIYFKLEKAPTIKQEGDSLTVSFHDPVIRKNIELNPDIIVVEESLVADETNLSLAEVLRIDQGPMGFLQKENVHRLPVNSNREGIFVVGSSRDVQNYSKSCTDIDNMVLRINQLIGEGTKSFTAKAIVDREKCTICLTCYRCCPHGAISWDDKAIISSIACQGCGICASECPMDAIQLVDFTDAEMAERIKEAAAVETASAPKILAFCCQNSAYEAGMAAKTFNYKLPEGLQLIKVPCAGKIDIHYILDALVEGADGVLVLACHHGNCKSEAGNTYAQWRINDAYQKLEQVGIEKDRLEFTTLASNMAAGFARIVIDMEKRISQKKE
ncbi:MAG: hydrogenase iron-sulfur subunit [Desulfobacteraceae bacterium]|jgi:heterodisulfide reductase subunit A-like polyferredoxin/coenzyme F420-reducing hydrogenase delta subunit|nr:hydrogenase iron-sulfur subunit [Desulfobacteraceae bacterium]